jgi:hypothetical protein
MSSDLGAPADGDLVSRILTGDEDAFAALVSRYQGPLLRLARTFVRDASQAEDVVQDTWIGLLRGIERFEGTPPASRGSMSPPLDNLRGQCPHGLKRAARRLSRYGTAMVIDSLVVPQRNCSAVSLPSTNGKSKVITSV